MNNIINEYPAVHIHRDKYDDDFVYVVFRDTSYRDGDIKYKILNLTSGTVLVHAYDTLEQAYEFLYRTWEDHKDVWVKVMEEQL